MDLKEKALTEAKAIAESHQSAAFIIAFFAPLFIALIIEAIL